MRKSKTEWIEETLDNLVLKMPEADAAEYKAFKYLKIEVGFDNRVFVIYSPRGPRSGRGLNEQKAPNVLAIVKVTGFSSEIHSGASVRLFNETSGVEMTVGYTPKKLFNYPVYVSLPPSMHLKMGRQSEDHAAKQSFTFTLLVKCKNKAENYTEENVYMETPINLKKLFPIITETFKF